jgi:hypothetical protein
LHEDVECFMEVLRIEGLEGKVVDEEPAALGFGPKIGGDDIGVGDARATQKKTKLGIYLALQRNIAI